MPRKTKDTENNEVELEESKVKKTSKSTTAKKKTSTTKKASTEKKVSGTAKKTTTKKADEEKTSSTTKKASTTKKEPTVKKATTKKASTVKKADEKVEKEPAKKTTAKKTSAKKDTAEKASTKKTTASKKTVAKKSTTKKATTKKTTTKKTTTKKVATKKNTKKTEVVEYYDLPYRYNQTVVKILAQTPTNLFIYWDISDEDRENYKKQYGENFFETTKPILKIYNDTMNYNFEVDINDFANSWYLRVNDSKCDYRVELGRRPINFQPQINTNYIYISSSNKIESPNDRILFDKLGEMVYFRNTKTNTTRSKSIASLTFIKNMGKIYNIYNLYKELYNDEDINNLYNPSSRFF